uniref:GAG-pre-integrase domain-containing protein n=1 Tax=Lactuca sativa TaxID=4236 RepID=A0A9R1VAX9_LACSA|nr:hypothetical protein LSAT_V11C600337700 [Lactuca sativa]
MVCKDFVIKRMTKELERTNLILDSPKFIWLNVIKKTILITRGRVKKCKYESHNKKSNKKFKDSKDSKCHLKGHMKRECRVKLGNKGASGCGKDGAGGGSGSHDQSATKGQISIDLVSLVFNVMLLTLEASFVQEVDTDSWWLDTCSTHHVCNDERWFTKLNIVNKGSVLHMVDEGSKPILGSGVVSITFTSGKTINLFDVLYVPKVRKNLVSSGLLNCMGYKQVIESNKYVLSKCGIFVGFGYYCDRVFKLNVISCFASHVKSTCMTSASNLDNSMLWHNRLGHVHIKRMVEMSKSGWIPAFDINSEKCKTCMLTKITKQLFPNVNRKSKVLELIHSDLCDFHATPSLGNKEYIVTFIDDSSRGIDCIFIGYAEHSKAYRFNVIEPNEAYSVHTIIESWDAIFDELRYSSIQRPKDLIPSSSEVPKSDGKEVVSIPETQQLRKSKRGRVAKNFGDEFQLFLVEGSRDKVKKQYSYSSHLEIDPKTFKEAMESQDVGFWKEAVDE